MRTFFRNILLVLFLVLNIKCQEDEVTARNYPRLKTLPVSEITKEGAQFNAEIIYSGDFEILNYGFVWDYLTRDPTLEKSDRVVYSNNVNTNSFSERIESSLLEGYIYYVRAFVQTNDFLVYGESVSFTSLGSKAPEIFSFSPTSGTWGDTINIKGKNFSNKITNNFVELGKLETKIISSTDSTISVQVPTLPNETTVSLKVSIAGNSSTAKDNFIYLSPSITNISPINVTFGDTVTISGENFGSLKEWNQVLIENLKAELTNVNSTEIKFLVPDDLKNKTNKIEVTSVGQNLTINQNIVLKSPEITGFSPETASRPNQIITIYGKNFNPKTLNNFVDINGFASNILYSSPDSIKIELPRELIPEYYISTFQKAKISLKVGLQSVTANKELIIDWKSTWTKKKNFPGLARNLAVAFSLGDFGYFGTGINEQSNTIEYLKDFWKYDPKNDTWSQITDFPGKARASASSFTIGNLGYIGLGTEKLFWYTRINDETGHFKDCYAYDPSTNRWTNVEDFPGIGRYLSASFSKDSKGFVFTGRWGDDGPINSIRDTNEGWQYDPTSNNWTKIENFPVTSSQAVGLNSGNQGYIYHLDKLFQYVNNEWKILQTETPTLYTPVTFGIKGKIYYGLGSPYQTTLYEFNPITLKTNYFDIDIYHKRGASVFVIDSKAYIIGNFKDVWEFDPSKPDI